VTRRSGRARSASAGPLRSANSSRDAGMVTAEFAVALPAFVVVVVAALSGVAVMTAQLRCVDAADVAARMAARGEPTSLVTSTALTGAPGRAQIHVATTGTLVTATVQAHVSLLGLSYVLPGVDVHATVVEALEPSAPAVAAGDGDGR
jgi:Flp pilus assembly protein TadG